ncbi:hypothetical protein [Paenibacillus sp. PK3_47]|uniref:hypothetical protein n=1 Tax=Paenibacillus sp. PK3_47 TaxID=2072642 RepID=UPI00201E1D9D|nr:hypothetical protein [Paenibacillus sp. PK3_47]
MITRDNQYAAKSAGILAEWAKTLKVIDGRDRILGAGINAYKYASAAEILRYYGGGYSGYSEADFTALQDMMLNVVYPVIQDAAVPMLANGNWDAAAMIFITAVSSMMCPPSIGQQKILPLRHHAGCSRGQAKVCSTPGHP